MKTVTIMTSIAIDIFHWDQRLKVTTKNEMERNEMKRDRREKKSERGKSGNS